MTKEEIKNVIDKYCNIFGIQTPQHKTEKINNYGSYDFINKIIIQNVRLINNVKFNKELDLVFRCIGNLMHELRHHHQLFFNQEQAKIDNCENMKINAKSSEVDSYTLWTEQDAYHFQVEFEKKYFNKVEDDLLEILNPSFSGKDIISSDISKLPQHLEEWFI